MTTSTTESNTDFEHFYQGLNLDISKILIAIVGLFYGCGYLIQAITLRNYGVQRLETLKFQYIEVGVTFAVLSLLVTIVPVACYLAHFRIRKKSIELPHFYIGAVGYLCNTYNLFMILLFFALFMTNWEMNSLVITPIFHAKLYLFQVLLIYFAFSLPVLILMPIAERLIVSKLAPKKVKVVYWSIIEPIRYLAVFVAIWFDLLLLTSFPWLQKLIINGLAFLSTSVLLFATLYAIYYFMNRLGDKKSLYLLATLGITGVFVVLYMSINAYVFGIIRYLPMNRGGKMPITKAYIISDNKIINQLPIKSKTEGEKTTLGPIYILEETQDFFHVTEEIGVDWFTKWITVYSIKKDAVDYILNERITTGGPRGTQ